MSNGERISPYSFGIKYLKSDLAVFFLVLCSYVFILSRDTSKAGIERITWIVDRLGTAIPVAIVLTLTVELIGVIIVWLINWYRESRRAKREEEIEAAREEGRREGRAEVEAELEAALLEYSDESNVDTANASNSSESQ